MSHVRHKLVKVLHRFTYIHHSSPFAFLDMSAPRGAVSRAERRELGTLEREICQYTDRNKRCLPTDVGNKSSISELPMRDGPLDSKREGDG